MHALIVPQQHEPHRRKPHPHHGPEKHVHTPVRTNKQEQQRNRQDGQMNNGSREQKGREEKKATEHGKHFFKSIRQ